MKPEAGQARLLCQRSPSRSPTLNVLCRVKRRDVIADYLFAAEGELGNESRKDVVRRLDRAEGLSSSTQPCQRGNRNVRQWDNPLASRRLRRTAIHDTRS